MQNWKFALTSILGHKMRSFLTMLGVIIGVAAVSTIMAIGNGYSQFVTKQATAYQHDVQIYFSTTGTSQDNVYDLLESPDKKAPKVQEEWLQKVVDDVPGTTAYYVTNGTSGTISYGSNKAKQVTLTGVSQNYFDTNHNKILAGRRLMASDYQHFSRFIMIDQVLADKLFDTPEQALNEIITINNKMYRVIGVFVDPNAGSSAYGADSSGSAILANTQLAEEFGVDQVSNIFIHVPDATQSATVGQQAAKELTQLSSANNGSFKMYDIRRELESVQTIITAMTLFIGIIGGTSLLVGGIGVMNIMLVSVTERTREIGLRKALGATRRHILTQFLIESVTLTLIGGLIGLVLTLLITSGLGSIQGFVNQIGKPAISINALITSIVFSILVGAVFGILPANKASKLDPIEALRYE